jgi:hypothetical protein
MAKARNALPNSLTPLAVENAETNFICSSNQF